MKIDSKILSLLTHSLLKVFRSINRFSFSKHHAPFGQNLRSTRLIPIQNLGIQVRLMWDRHPDENLKLPPPPILRTRSYDGSLIWALRSTHAGATLSLFHPHVQYKKKWKNKASKDRWLADSQAITSVRRVEPVPRNGRPPLSCPLTYRVASRVPRFPLSRNIPTPPGSRRKVNGPPMRRNERCPRTKKKESGLNEDLKVSRLGPW